jgi:hypothetical protein
MFAIVRVKKTENQGLNSICDLHANPNGMHAIAVIIALKVKIIKISV